MEYYLRERTTRSGNTPMHLSNVSMNRPTSTKGAMGRRIEDSMASLQTKLDIIMEQLSKLQNLPTQIEEMKSEMKSLKAAVTDMAESVEFMENAVESG